jgi:hypothetical protein
MEKYYGNYLGIVVSEDGGDPERRGRVQVWIPGITNTFYGGWNDDVKNKDVYYIGDDSELSHYYVQKLRAVLPWAECASPLIGGGTPLHYNETSSGSYQESVPVSDADISGGDESPVSGGNWESILLEEPEKNTSNVNDTVFINPVDGKSTIVPKRNALIPEDF